MRFFEFATAVTAIGCGTGVILGTVEMVLSARRPRTRPSAAPELQPTPEQLTVQAVQAQEIALLRRQNEQLQKQLEWHTRLLAAGSAPAGATINTNK